jgi:peptidoglycan/xylan/chitin deacetylase (PgdA/CDA1 family)
VVVEAPPLSDVLALCYHAVSERWPADLSVAPGAFESQLRLLVERGYLGVTFTEAVLAPPAEKTLAVTFDDAYRSVLELAFPIMSSLGLKGTVFVPTAFAGREEAMAWPGIDQWLDGPHEHELKPMSWDELRELRDAGWEIGSHTRSHPHLTQLDDERLAAELESSKADCEDHMAAPCHSLAYPYGDVDARVAGAARRAAYRTAAALPRRLVAGDPLVWPRVGVWHLDDLGRFKAKVSPRLRRLRASRAWESADALRRLAGRRR